MAERRNLLLETLQYLEQFYGDGLYYNLEEIFSDVAKEARDNALKELKESGFIDYTGGGMTVAYFSYCLGHYPGEMEPAQKYKPVEGMIKLKGLDYLKRLKTMNQEEQHKGGIIISGVSGSSIIVGSPQASITVNNSPEQLDQVNKIIESLKSDSSLKDMVRMEMLELMIELKSELKRGPVTDQSLIERIATVGSGLATVATYLRPLLLGFGVVI